MRHLIPFTKYQISIIESSDNAENNIYDIVDFMISIMSKDQLNQVEDMLTNQYPED